MVASPNWVSNSWLWGVIVTAATKGGGGGTEVLVAASDVVCVESSALEVVLVVVVCCFTGCRVGMETPNGNPVWFPYGTKEGMPPCTCETKKKYY